MICASVLQKNLDSGEAAKASFGYTQEWVKLCFKEWDFSY